MVLGQVAQGGCGQTHHVFSFEELKALSQSHLGGCVWAGREVCYLHWSHDEAGWDPVSDGEQSSLCSRSAVPREGSARNRAGDPQQDPCDLLPHVKAEGIIAYKVCFGADEGQRSPLSEEESQSGHSGMDQQAWPDSSLLSCPLATFFGP